jgi:hypothetical protein
MTLNTNGTTSWRKKWMPNILEGVLKSALVADKICDVDTSDVKYIENPYTSSATVTQQAIAGTYSVGTSTSTNDTLTVTEEFVWSEQIYDFEKIAQLADLKQKRSKEAMATMAVAIDKYVLNNLLDVGTGTYTTPAGGFSTAANVNQIFADLFGKFTGYANSYDGLYVVIENTDVTGIIQAGAVNGFNFADMWLKNGLLTNYMGIDIYVVRSGTFVTATLGTTAYTNSGHRLAGVKGISTIARPGARMTWMEKEVSGKTGVECALAAYVGHKAWYQKLALTIDITLA